MLTAPAGTLQESVLEGEALTSRAIELLPFATFHVEACRVGMGTGAMERWLNFSIPGLVRSFKALALAAEPSILRFASLH